MEISFSLALIIFAVLLTPLYLILLQLSNKLKNGGAPKRRDPIERSRVNTTAKIGVSIFILELVLLALTVFPAIITTELYLAVILSITGCLLWTLLIMPNSKKPQVSVLFLMIFFHLIILNPLPSQIEISERSPAIAKLSIEGTWNSEWRLLNPYYNPFPMDAGLFLIFSEITSISHISGLTICIIGLFFTVAFDLTLYILIKRLARSWRVGILGILVLAFTPPTLVNPQPMWLSGILLLICISAVIEMLSDTTSVSYAIISIVSYVAAIFTHGVATQGLLVLAGLLVSISLLRTERNITNVKKEMLRITFVTLVVITLARWVYSSGVMESIVTNIRAIALGMSGSGVEFWGTGYEPLYDVFVSPIHAYAWSTPISMASALTIYHFIRKKSSSVLEETSILTMCVIGMTLLVVGFSTFSAFRRYTYPAFIFIIPAAAVTGGKISKSRKSLAIVTLLLLIAFSGIGLQDPALSPELYKATATSHAARTEDYIEVCLLSSVITGDYSVVAPYEILVSLNYLAIAEGKTVLLFRDTISLKVHRFMIEKAVRDHEVSPDVVYIWTTEIESHLANMTVNILYDSRRHIAFERSG